MYPKECPNCKADLQDHKTQASDGTYPYYRVIGRYSLASDRTVAWKCPDCDHIWPREDVMSDKVLRHPKQ